MDAKTTLVTLSNSISEPMSDEAILRSKSESLINFKTRPNSGIKISPTRLGEKSKTDWRILAVKIVCGFFIVFSLIVAIAPFAGLVNFFLSPLVNVSVSVNTQTERLDNKCEIMNNSSLGFDGNRSSNLTLECEFPYTSNGSLCVPVCGMWHPGGLGYGIASRFITCLAASISLIGCILGIFTWIKIGKKLFEFPQVIPFYLLICAAIQALCILVGQIHYEKFYCSEENLIGSRQQPTIQCYVQGAVFHYASMIFVFWYLIYVIAVLLVLSFPLKLRFVNGGSWKMHLVLFIIAIFIPLLILVIFWGIDTVYYEIVNHPVVCLPEPTAIVVTIILPLSLMQFLSLSSISLIIAQLIINKFRLRNHKVSMNALSNEQNQFIIRTLGVTVIFTGINLFLSLEFGTRVSDSPLYESYVELFWACITRYGTNTSCCVNNYIQFYKPELTTVNDFFFSSWGLVALSTLGVKDARVFWYELFKKCLCFRRKPAAVSAPSGSSFQIGTLTRKLTGVLFLRNSDKENQVADSGIETETETKA